jgi:hypothetical protein
MSRRNPNAWSFARIGPSPVALTITDRSREYSGEIEHVDEGAGFVLMAGPPPTS